MGLIRTPWTRQPQIPVGVDSGIRWSSVLVPRGNAWRSVIPEPAWTPSGTLTADVCAAGVSVRNLSTAYTSRTNPVATEPLTICLVFTPQLLNGLDSIWSIGDSPVSGTPALIIQQNVSDIRVFYAASYVGLFSGVAIIGRPLSIVFCVSNIAVSAASSWSLSVNGVTLTGSGTNSSYVLTNEYLGAGYANAAKGHYSLYARAPVFLPGSAATRLSTNPWQLFAPLSRRVWVPETAPALPSLGVSTFVPGSITSSGFRPRITAT